jgi:hypothetical protein
LIRRGCGAGDYVDSDERASGSRQFNDDDLGRATKANGEQGTSNTGSGISLHAFVAPMAEGILAGTIGELHECPDTRDTDLSGVGVSAQVEIDTRGPGFGEHLGGVGEEQLEVLFRHILGGFPKIVASEEMRVINSNHPERGIRRAYRRRFIDQHLDAHIFQFEGDLGAVMVSKNAEDAVARLDGVQDVPHTRVDVVTGTPNVEAVVAGEETQIDGKGGKRFGQDFGQSVHAVYVEIAQVEKPEAVERGREVREFQPQLANDRPEGVGPSSPIEANGLERGLDAPGKDDIVMEDEVAMAVGSRTPVMERLDGAALGQTRFERAAAGFKRGGLEQGSRVTIIEGAGWPLEVMRVPDTLVFHLIFC